jgi:hypothetical protein
VPMSGLVTTFDTVIRAGYPQGVPQADYVPLSALLRRRLPDNAVAAVATHVAASGDLNIDAADIRPSRGNHRTGPTAASFTWPSRLRIVGSNCRTGDLDGEVLAVPHSGFRRPDDAASLWTVALSLQPGHSGEQLLQADADQVGH